MTGEQLVAELLKLGPTTLKRTVSVEGCDCEETAGGVILEGEGILIIRSDSVYSKRG